MFDDQFEVLLADNEPARSLHYRVRYQVYCLETGYENPGQYPEGEERDRWDEHAAHFLVRHRQNGAWVAAMRIILPKANSLPMLRLTGLEKSYRLPASLHSAAEISRVCVIGRYRRRGPEPLHPHEMIISAARRNGNRNDAMPDTHHRPERRHGPGIMAGLLRAGVTYSMQNGISDWYFLTTRALARVLSQMGVKVAPVGQACNYRGERHPYLVNVPDITNRTLAISPLFQSLFHGDSVPYRPFSALQPTQTQPRQTRSMLLQTAAG